MAFETGSIILGFGLALFSLVAPMLGVTLPRWLLAGLLSLSVILMLVWPFSYILTWLHNHLDRMSGLVVTVLIGALIGGLIFGIVWIKTATTVSIETNGRSNQTQTTQDQLARLEFLANKNRAVAEARFVVILDKAYTVEELQHFRILLEVMNMDSRGPDNEPSTLWLSARDSYVTWRRDNKVTLLFGLKHVAWSRHPEISLQNTSIGASVLGEAGRRSGELIAWGTIQHRGPFQTIESFDRTWLNIYVTNPLVDKVRYVGFTVDNYLLLGLPTECLEIKKNVQGPVAWSEPLNADEANTGWAQLLTTRYWPNDETRPPLRPPMKLDFDLYTPLKLTEGNSTANWRSIKVPTCDMAKLFPY